MNLESGLVHLAEETLDRVLHEAGYSHRAYSTGNRSDYRSLRLDGGIIDITA